VRVFADANVMVSSFSFEGVTRQLVALLVESHEIIVSPQVLEEFRRVSVEKIGVDPRTIDAFLQEFVKTVEVIMPPYEDRLEVRDPTDIDILAAAIKANADVLVSGDKDLLEFKDSPIPVMKPRALYDLLVGDE
jgi:putative PIN family toxin of toxin-antitoxin system